MKDPDSPDDSYKATIEFGTASSFITGNFPSYLINPKSNVTDPGVYSCTVTLIDDNPSPQSSSYNFKIIIVALQPVVENARKTNVTAIVVRPILNRSNVTYDPKAKKPKDLKAKIISISPMGDVIVSFSSELAVPGNYT